MEVKEVLDAMQGMTYREWQILKTKIDMAFQKDIRKQNDEILLSDTNRILNIHNEI